MKKLAYFPGCTVKTTALSMETSAKKVLSQMGVELAEMPKWNCCGVASPLAEDNLMHHISSVRNLVHAGRFCGEIGVDRLVTLCSVCYNTLKRAEVELAKSPDKLKTISFFLGEDSNEDVQKISENGGALNFPKVVHLLQCLDKKAVGDAVKHRLEGLKVMSYYGCALTRPESVKVDDSLESPTIMEGLVSALGATPVDDPYKTECCGSYHIVSDERAVEGSVKRIVGSAKMRGVDAIITACPLCSFNIGQHSEIPVLYFTELIELAFFGKTATGFEFSGGKLKKAPKSEKCQLAPAVMICNNQGGND